MKLWKYLLISAVLAGNVFAGGGLPAEALSPGEPAFVGQTYYITGRDVWIRDEPNTNVPAVAAYRFGEPVTLLGTKGRWAHVRLANGWERYVHMDYMGTKETVRGKLKATTECMLELDRIYDDVERLMTSLHPNGPDAKAPGSGERKASCEKLMGRLNALSRRLESTAMNENARNEIGRLRSKVGIMINFLAEWDKGGQEKYTPYFLDTFMPDYERVGGLYR